MMDVDETTSTFFLASIFEFGLALAMQDDNAVEFLLTITSVCRLWRDCAIHTPSLWRSIVCVDSPTAHSSLSRLAASLERSEPLELDVVIHLVDASRDSTASIIGMMRPHFTRCRALTITLVNADGLPTILPLDEYFPLLRSLAVTLHPPSPRSHPQLHLFGPRFRCNELSWLSVEVAADWRIVTSGARIDTLRALSMSAPDLSRQQLLHMIPHGSTRLKSLALRDVLDVESTFSNSPALDVRQLNSLALLDCRIPLTCFTAPALRTLRLGLQSGLKEYSSLFPYFTPFPDLRTLSLGIIFDIPGVPALAAAFIRTCASLETLELVAESSATQILILLASNLRTMPLGLKTIRLQRSAWVEAEVVRAGSHAELYDMFFDLTQVLRTLLAVRRNLGIHWVQNGSDGHSGYPRQLTELKVQFGMRVELTERIGSDIERDDWEAD